jgi:hypothetical protein
MSDIEISPYQRALRQDLTDYELLRAGLGAYERISGVSAEDALVHLATAATPEQRERVLKRCERGEEFRNSTNCRRSCRFG